MQETSRESTFDWKHLELRLREALVTLVHFLKHPVDGICHLPDWDWPVLLIIQSTMSIAAGVLTDLILKRYLGAAVAVVVAPIRDIAISLILSGMFYYLFLFLFHKQILFRSVVTHLTLASIPVLVTEVLNPLVSLAPLFGLATAAGLLSIGFVRNYGIPPSKMRLVLAGLFLVYAVAMIAGLASTRGKREKLRLRATPESLDILEKEMKTED